MIVLIIFAYIAWGFFVGLIVGFTAIGKAIIGTPGLILIFGLNPVTAVGTIGLTGGIMMISSTIQHYREGNVELKIGILFSITSVPISIITATYTDKINNIIPLNVIIGIIIFISVIFLFYRYIIIKSKPRELKIDKWKLILSPLLGIIAGALIGATSISGSIIVIFFILILKLPSPHAVGTTSFVAALALLFGAISHIQHNHIDWLVSIALLPGLVVGANIGSRFIKRIPRIFLRYSLLVVLILAAILTIINP